MIRTSTLLGFALLVATAASAQARDPFRNLFFPPWPDREVRYYDDSYGDDGYYDDNAYDEEDVIIERRPRRVQPRIVEDDTWWMEDDARIKLEQRKKVRTPSRKIVTEQPRVKVKPRLKAEGDVETASLTRPDGMVKPKLKPVAPKPVLGKTIGCTAGAAVVTGYGFADVKPKACTGKTFAYTAARAGKTYEIKLTAASGEIIDVKKVN
jgi:hypothetical protein